MLIYKNVIPVDYIDVYRYISFLSIFRTPTSVRHRSVSVKTCANPLRHAIRPRNGTRLVLDLRYAALRRVGIYKGLNRASQREQSSLLPWPMMKSCAWRAGEPGRWCTRRGTSDATFSQRSTSLWAQSYSTYNPVTSLNKGSLQNPQSFVPRQTCGMVCRATWRLT